MSHAEDTRPDIKLVNASGRVSVREVFGGTLYFRRPHLTMRAAVANCIQRFFTLVGPNALEYYFDYDGEQADIDAATLARVVHERFDGPDHFPNASFEMEGAGLYAPGYFLQYLGSANDNPELPNEAGTLQLWMPREFFLAQRDKVLGFLDEAFACLPLSCGQVGLGLSGENMLRKQAIATLHPGLDIANPRSVSTDIGESASGVSWQTLLGPGLTRALGGTHAIAQQLPALIVVEALPLGGARITAGPNPGAGDSTDPNTLPSHHRVARMLDAAGLLHLPQHVVYFRDHAGLVDRAAMHHWHQRWRSDTRVGE